MRVSLGIDPGKKGGIAIISEDRSMYAYYAIPLIKGKEIDITKLSEIFLSIIETYHVANVCIEDVHSIFGASAKANFQFGWCVGYLQGMVAAYQLPFIKVKPKDWQKEMWEGVSLIKKLGSTKTDTKATSLIAAQRLFPGDKFLATPRSSTPHDGIYDALLMAEYGRRKYL